MEKMDGVQKKTPDVDIKALDNKEDIDNLEAKIKSAPDKSIFEPLKVEIKTNNKITVNNTPLEKCSEDIINYLKEKVDE